MLQLPRFVLFLFLFSGIFWLHISCGKEPQPPDILSGIVKNKKTDAPIEGAFIPCSGKKGDLGHEYFKDFSVHSDTQGKFLIIIPKEYTSGFSAVTKEGYLPNVHPDKFWTLKGDTFFFDIQLIPIDGFLHVTVNNMSGQYDSIFVKIMSPTTFTEGLGIRSLKKFPVVLTLGETYKEVLALPSEEKVFIYWDYKNFSDTDALYRDSIYLPTGDTTDFSLLY